MELSHELFRDPQLFSSPSRWREAGFDVAGKGIWSGIMVASHPTVPDYLFKKYGDTVSLQAQLENCQCRVEGANKLRQFILDQRLTRVVVPRKFLYELPSMFSSDGIAAHVLIVERMPILSRSASKRMFRAIPYDVLRELCLVMTAFRGLESGARNVPFTRVGQVAFVDTERWNKGPLKKRVLLKGAGLRGRGNRRRRPATRGRAQARQVGRDRTCTKLQFCPGWR
jgi:hypothetical protein